MDAYPRSYVLTAQNIEVAAMPVDYPFCNRKSQTCSAFLTIPCRIRAVEAFKYVGHILAGDADAAVLNNYDRAAVGAGKCF